MPYSVGRSKVCPASKPFAVLKEGGKLVPGGCHASRADAVKHQRALVVHVSDAAELDERRVAFELYRGDRAMMWRDL